LQVVDFKELRSNRALTPDFRA